MTLAEPAVTELQESSAVARSAERKGNVGPRVTDFHEKDGW